MDTFLREREAYSLKDRFLAFLVLFLPFFLGCPAARAEQATSLNQIRIALLIPAGSQAQGLGQATRVFLEGRLNQPLKEKGFALQAMEVPMPVTPAEAKQRVANLKQQGFDGAISLLSGPENAILARLGNPPFPILLTWSEEVPIPPGNDSFLFGIDFEESFRPIAWTLWARKHSPSEWDFYTESLDVRLNRLARETEAEFANLGLSVRSYRFRRNRPEQYGDLFSLSSSGGKRSALIWLEKDQAAAIGEALAFRAGVGSFICLGKDLPVLVSSSRFRYLTQDPNGGDRFTKARLAAVWLAEAVLAGDSPPRDARKLARALEKVQRIEGSGEEIWLCPERHRPFRKAVFFLRPRSGTLEITERMLLEKKGEEFVSPIGR